MLMVMGVRGRLLCWGMFERCLGCVWVKIRMIDNVVFIWNSEPRPQLKLPATFDSQFNKIVARVWVRVYSASLISSHTFFNFHFPRREKKKFSSSTRSKLWRNWNETRRHSQSIGNWKLFRVKVFFFSIWLESRSVCVTWALRCFRWVVR